MSKTNTIRVGDLLQNLNPRAVELWVVTSLERNAKLPKGKPAVRIGSKERANNKSWSWDWCEVSSLSGLGSKVIYWDGNTSEDGYRLSTSDNYRISWSELYTLAEAEEIRENWKRAEENRQLWNEKARWVVNKMEWTGPSVWLSHTLFSSAEFKEVFGTTHEMELESFEMKPYTNNYTGDPINHIEYWDGYDKGQSLGITVIIDGKHWNWTYKIIK